MAAPETSVDWRERLAGFNIPRATLFDTNPLPRTPTGKVQKNPAGRAVRESRVELSGWPSPRRFSSIRMPATPTAARYGT